MPKEKDILYKIRFRETNGDKIKNGETLWILYEDGSVWTKENMNEYEYNVVIQYLSKVFYEVVK